MRISITLLILLPVIATAQNYHRLEALPTCVTTCLASVRKACAAGDTACYCSNQQVLYNIGACITTVCQGDDLGPAVEAAASLCATTGAPTSFEVLPSATTSAAEASLSEIIAELSETSSTTSATIGTQTGAIVASVFSAKSSLGTMTSQATTSLFSENAIASSASGHSSSLSASAASATSSNGAMPIGNIWVSVFAGGLMLAGGIVAGL